MILAACVPSRGEGVVRERRGRCLRSARFKQSALSRTTGDATFTANGCLCCPKPGLSANHIEQCTVYVLSGWSRWVCAE